MRTKSWTREKMSESTEDVAQEETEAPDNQEDSTLLDGGVDDSLLDGDDNPPAEEEDPVRQFTFIVQSIVGLQDNFINSFHNNYVPAFAGVYKPVS